MKSRNEGKIRCAASGYISYRVLTRLSCFVRSQVGRNNIVILRGHCLNKEDYHLSIRPSNLQQPLCVSVQTAANTQFATVEKVLYKSKYRDKTMNKC